MNYSDMIRKLREEKGLKQSQLGELLGMSSQAVSKWETGKSAPDLDTVSKMCELFDVSADYLFGRTETRNADKLIAIHSTGVMAWINDRAFNEQESAILKENYDEVLFRYKQLINATANNLKYNEEWGKLISGGASLEELALYSCKALKTEICDIINYVAAFPYYFNSKAIPLHPEKMNILFEEIHSILGVKTEENGSTAFNLSDDEKEILELWSKLDLDGKRIVLGVATEQKQRGEKGESHSQTAG